MAQTSIITGQYVCIHQEAATLIQRILAWVIDFILIIIYSMVITGLLTNIMVRVTSGDVAAIIIVIGYLPIFFYPLLMETFNHGKTIGKSIMGIRVMCLDGTEPTKTAYLLRWLLLGVDMLMSGLGLAFIIFSKNSQRIGDMAAGTTVVQTSKKKMPMIIRTPLIQANYFVPTYPEVMNLNMRQISVVEDVLYMEESPLRQQRISQLAQKVIQALGIRPADDNEERLLITIFNDFNYYATSAESSG